MSTSGGSNLELAGPGDAVIPAAVGGGGGGRAVSMNNVPTTAAPGVVTTSPYIRLSSLAVPHQQSLQHHQQQQQQQYHPIYQKVVDPSTVLNNKSSLQKTIIASNPEESLSSATSSKPLIKDTPTYEIQDNEPYIVTVRNSPARSLVKSVSGSSVPSSGGVVPAGLKVFPGASKAGPRLALYRSNSSLDLLDRDNYLNNQARAFHSHAHQLSPQQRVHLMNAAAQNHHNQVHGSVGVTTGCFTRRKDFGSHGSIDVLSAQNASIIGGGHAVRSGSVGTCTTRPFLSLMNPSGADGILHNLHNKPDQLDGGGRSGSGSSEESKSLPVPSKVSGVTTRETSSPRLRLKFQKLWEHGSGSGSSKDKQTNNGNDKGMGNTVPSTNTTSSKAEASIFRKFRGVSSASRQQASKSLPEATKFDTTIHIGEAGDSVTTKVVLRHPGTNPMEERYRRRALAHYDCQSISANISYAARLRGLLSKRRNTTTGASAASLCQRSPPENNNSGSASASSTINGGGSPTSGSGPSLPQHSSHNNNPSSASSSTSNLLQVPGQQDSDLGDGKSNALVLR